MAIAAKVITVKASSAAEAEDSINDALALTPIEAVNYLESITIAYSEKNQEAMIVIWYDDGS